VTKGTYFEDTAPATCFRTRAILALAAAAPDACAAARGLREGLKMLWFEGHADAKRPAPFDVAPLARFTALERLDIVRAPEITHPEALAALRALKSLAIRASGPCALPDLSAHPSLESVSLHDFDVADASRALAAPSLLRATFSSLKGDGALRASNHPKLQSLSVSSSQGIEKVSLVGCTALIDLQVSWTQGLESLDMTGCTGLRAVALHMCPKLSTLRGFESLTALARFNGSSLPPACLPREPLDHLTQLGEVDFNTSTLTDCEALTVFSHATLMTLSSSKDLRDVSALAKLTRLRTLSLQWCSQVTDVTPLEGLPLQRLAIHGSGVVPASVPLALKRAVK
jgi:Leucine-rich repeat (LRR) protein